uniref:Uncharacterized protein n=1 Tax=mine drainage metagenome TaxID=410659 RepID=E6QX50_9ZZZZ
MHTSMPIFGKVITFANYVPYKSIAQGGD